VAAVFVVTMIFWMNRVARHLKKEIEQKVESYAERAGKAAGGYRAIRFPDGAARRSGTRADSARGGDVTEGLQTWIGTGVGIGAAVAVGVLFFKGTLKVPLHRFFAVTSAITDPGAINWRLRVCTN